MLSNISFKFGIVFIVGNSRQLYLTEKNLNIRNGVFCVFLKKVLMKVFRVRLILLDMAISFPSFINVFIVKNHIVFFFSCLWKNFEDFKILQVFHQIDTKNIYSEFSHLLQFNHIFTQQISMLPLLLFFKLFMKNKKPQKDLLRKHLKCLHQKFFLEDFFK